MTEHACDCKEQLASWMIRNDLSTGHGDTVEDLLAELKWQIEEIRSSGVGGF